MNRRLYSQLEPIEKDIIKLALPREAITRDQIIEELSDEYTKTAIKDAFSSLGSENRLYRVGNKSDHILIRRDLF